MTSNYTYTKSADFINNLLFDYIETYLLQRGEEFEETQKRNQQQYETLYNRKNKKGLTIEEEKHFDYLPSLRNTPYLINEDENIHWSAQKTNTFSSGNPIIEKLKNILLVEGKNIPMWLCAPIYRDAIVFYRKENNILTTLNVCLSCEYMETSLFNHINADEKVYELLRGFFIEIGHKVEGK